ncbi:siderophore-interacting protein [Arthrobacter sp. StoSoilA2]|uniref:sigma-54-dependent Fis family transcriptional regulator n=1 Tax=Arthrobacter sp. StoSoilA2 TaxID=2830990 RepID=UPI001CC357DA|nr:helix-turn-helix domain-containing protein [Arthrobacter sp. StoSoilA2]BCW35860.1 siderophore-interacting protein [Arthrobacter sp. StoSoilA2]
MQWDDKHEVLRDPIAQSWRRASQNGLNPGSVINEGPQTPIDPHSRLVRAARPVLDAVTDQLLGERFSILLANRDSVIVDRRLGQSQLGARLDTIFAVPGFRYDEDRTGTNSLATVFEIGQGIAVDGREHFLEILKDLSCYGHPIIHPVTKRLEGVLDITCFASDSTSLMMPLLARAAHDVELRLLAGSPTSQQRILAAFQARSARVRAPLIALGNGLTLANDAATQLFTPELQRTVRELHAEHGASIETELRLESGEQRELKVHCTVVPGTDGALLVEVRDGDRTRPAIPRRGAPGLVMEKTVERLRALQSPVLIRGEQGSGRSHLAKRLAGDRPTRILDPRELSDSETSGFHKGFRSVSDELIIIEDIDLLDSWTARRLGRHLDEAEGWFVMTCGPDDNLGREHLGISSRCLERIDLPPLRHRRDEIGVIAREVVRDLQPQAWLSSETLHVLERHRWPGNVAELVSVLRHAVAQCAKGAIGVQALPQRYRTAPSRRRFTPMEQAEIDTIMRALADCLGNKVHAAAALGIGRTTLYRRMNALGIQG